MAVLVHSHPSYRPTTELQEKGVSTLAFLPSSHPALKLIWKSKDAKKEAFNADTKHSMWRKMLVEAIQPISDMSTEMTRYGH